MTEEALDILDHVRRNVNGNTERAERADMGQFLTSVAIARFMASLFAPNRLDHVGIIDAGAGAGVLFSAYVERLVSEERRPHSIEVVAYENDGRILPELTKTMAHCESACEKEGIAFHLLADVLHSGRTPLFRSLCRCRWKQDGFQRAVIEIGRQRPTTALPSLTKPVTSPFKEEINEKKIFVIFKAFD